MWKFRSAVCISLIKLNIKCYNFPSKHFFTYISRFWMFSSGVVKFSLPLKTNASPLLRMALCCLCLIPCAVSEVSPLWLGWYTNDCQLCVYSESGFHTATVLVLFVIFPKLFLYNRMCFTLCMHRQANIQQTLMQNSGPLYLPSLYFVTK